MYEVTVTTKFDAAHCYEGIGGPERSLHGHTFSVEVVYQAREPNELGMVVHDKDIIKMTRKIVAQLDHVNLCEQDVFKDTKEHNPTLENIASVIFGTLQVVCPKWMTVHSVKVWTSPEYAVKYIDKFTTSP